MSMTIVFLAAILIATIITAVVYGIRNSRKKACSVWWDLVFPLAAPSIFLNWILYQTFAFYQPLFSIFGIGPTHVMFVSWTLVMAALVVAAAFKEGSRPRRIARVILITGLALVSAGSGWLVVDLFASLFSR